MSREIKEKHRVRFNEWSKSYDASILQRIVFNTSHDMFFKEITPFLEDGMEILDIGCGTGKFAFRLHDLNRNLSVHGIDISDHMIKKAQEKVKDELIEFRIGEVEELPYESDRFDIVTCSNSFHHYPDQKKAVSEMHRTLKHNGRLMIVDGCCDTLLGSVIFRIVELIERHVYHVSEREIREMLFAAGFDGITQKRFNPIAPLLFTLGHARKGDVSL